MVFFPPDSRTGSTIIARPQEEDGDGEINLDFLDSGKQKINPEFFSALKNRSRGDEKIIRDNIPFLDYYRYLSTTPAPRVKGYLSNLQLSSRAKIKLGDVDCLVEIVELEETVMIGIRQRETGHTIYLKDFPELSPESELLIQGEDIYVFHDEESSVHRLKYSEGQMFVENLSGHFSGKRLDLQLLAVDETSTPPTFVGYHCLSHKLVRYQIYDQGGQSVMFEVAKQPRKYSDKNILIDSRGFVWVIGWSELVEVLTPDFKLVYRGTYTSWDDPDLKRKKNVYSDIRRDEDGNIFLYFWHKRYQEKIFLKKFKLEFQPGEPCSYVEMKDLDLEEEPEHESDDDDDEDIKLESDDDDDEDIKLESDEEDIKLESDDEDIKLESESESNDDNDIKLESESESDDDDIKLESESKEHDDKSRLESIEIKVNSIPDFSSGKEFTLALSLDLEDRPMGTDFDFYFPEDSQHTIKRGDRLDPIQQARRKTTVDLSDKKIRNTIFYSGYYQRCAAGLANIPDLIFSVSCRTRRFLGGRECWVEMVEIRSGDSVCQNREDIFIGFRDVQTDELIRAEKMEQLQDEDQFLVQGSDIYIYHSMADKSSVFLLDCSNLWSISSSLDVVDISDAFRREDFTPSILTVDNNTTPPTLIVYDHVKNSLARYQTYDRKRGRADLSYKRELTRKIELHPIEISVDSRGFIWLCHSHNNIEVFSPRFEHLCSATYKINIPRKKWRLYHCLFLDSESRNPVSIVTWAQEKKNGEKVDLKKYELRLEEK